MEVKTDIYNIYFQKENLNEYTIIIYLINLIILNIKNTKIVVLDLYLLITLFTKLVLTDFEYKFTIVRSAIKIVRRLTTKQ